MNQIAISPSPVPHSQEGATYPEVEIEMALHGLSNEIDRIEAAPAHVKRLYAFTLLTEAERLIAASGASQ
jgi:hypothetical protein